MEKSMALSEIELRIAALEAEMARVKKRLEKGPVEREDWLDEIYGAFANDPHFEEAALTWPGLASHDDQHGSARSRLVPAVGDPRLHPQGGEGDGPSRRGAGP